MDFVDGALQCGVFCVNTGLVRAIRGGPFENVLGANVKTRACGRLNGVTKVRWLEAYQVVVAVVWERRLDVYALIRHFNRRL